MVESNFITLEPGVPKQLHFVDHAIAAREIMDPLLHILKPVETLTFVVDEEDGRRVTKTYSITSDRHKAEFAPLLPDKAYRNFTFIITLFGTGFGRRYEKIQIPRG